MKFDSVLLHRFWSLFLPLLIVLVGMILTINVYKSVNTRQTALEIQGFEQVTNSLVSRIDRVLDGSKSLLIGLRGLYDSSSNVTRAEFSQYLESVNFTTRFPGAEAISWHPRILHEDLPEFEQNVALDDSIQSGGYPDFITKPPSNNPEHFVLTYLQPLDGYMPLMGFDLSTNSERLAGVRLARDTGKIVATAPVDLFSFVVKPKGFILIVPVYKGSSPATVLQRQERFMGVLVGAFRFEGLLSSVNVGNLTALQVRDVTEPLSGATSTPMYSIGTVEHSHQKLVRTLHVAGRLWEVSTYQSDAALHVYIDSTVAHMILILGVLGSLLSALLLWALISSRNHAVSLAQSLTVDLTTANKNLLRSNNDLSQFAFVASHDLQTPVRNIESVITLLEAELHEQSDSIIPTYLNHLRSSSARMQKLVSDLLEYARIDHGRTGIHTIVDLNEVIDLVEKSLDLSIEETGATIARHNLPVIKGDADQLERLFMNLMSNAIKFRQPDRAIQIDISGEQSHESCIVRIRDNGIGVEEQFRSRVFEPFQRLHSYDAIEGTGLGLSICSQIAIAHGGSIKIETSDDWGTVMVLAFPQVAQLQQAA